MSPRLTHRGDPDIDGQGGAQSLEAPDGLHLVSSRLSCNRQDKVLTVGWEGCFGLRTKRKIGHHSFLLHNLKGILELHRHCILSSQCATCVYHPSLATTLFDLPPPNNSKSKAHTPAVMETATPFARTPQNRRLLDSEHLLQ